MITQQPNTQIPVPELNDNHLSTIYAIYKHCGMSLSPDLIPSPKTIIQDIQSHGYMELTLDLTTSQDRLVFRSAKDYSQGCASDQDYIHLEVIPNSPQKRKKAKDICEKFNTEITNSSVLNPQPKPQST